MKKRLIAITLTAGMVTTMFAGCGKKENVANTGTDIPAGEITYPIDTDKTLKYWVRLHPALGSSVMNYAETPFAKKYMEETGIKVEYVHPAQGQEEESLNLLIASGELPDIIEADWLSLDPDSSIEKKTIMRLNELMDTQAPNLKKYLESVPEINKAVKTDSGNYYAFPFVRNGEKLLSTAGLMMRADWLEELGLEAPETIAEWENVLEQFKEKKSTGAPLIAAYYELIYFAGAFGATTDFYVDNGTVKYSPMEVNFRDYMETMNRWYKKGLIDKNFALLDGQMRNSSILNGTSGATFGAGGGGLGNYLNSKSGEKYDLTAVKFPVLNKGDKPMFGNYNPPYSSINAAAITGKCSDVNLAVRFLDYSYSEEGAMLNNFGIEGESYEMIDGYPTYTDVITNNSEGLSMAQSLPLYVRAANEGPFVQDERYIEQYYALDRQKEALDIWSYTDHKNYKMPQVTLTREEADEYNKIMNNIKTFVDEAFIEFVIGSKPISEFDNFVNGIKDKNIDRAIEIQQTAYNRYINR